MSRDEELDVDAEEGRDQHEGAPDLDPVEACFDAVDERIENLSFSTLKPRIDGLEGERLRLRRSIGRGIAVLAVPIVLAFYTDLLEHILESAAGGSPLVRGVIERLPLVVAGLFVLAVAWVGVALAMPGIALFLNYRRRFKQELVAEIFRALLPAGSYQPDHHVTRAVFESSGIWPVGMTTFKGDDLVRGRVDGVEFEASELHAESAVKFQRRSKREIITRRSNLTIFAGVFVHAGLTRQLRGHTIVEPEAADGRPSGHRAGFQRIDLGDAAFAEYFRVYATDAAEAADVLNARVRERLVQLTDHLANAPFVAFSGRRAFIAVHSGRPQLEPTISTRASYATLSALAPFVALPELLVRELSPKESGEAAVAAPSILAEAPAAGFAAGLSAARSGTHTGHVFAGAEPAITAADVANLAMPAADERDLGLTPPPESHVRLSPLTGEGLDVRYGLTASFFMRVLWTLALTPPVIAGASRLIGEPARPALDAVVSNLPPMAAVAELASQWPVTFVLLAIVFYVLPGYALLKLPSGLRVSREGVRVAHRLWPMAKTFPMASIESVRISDRQVMLQQKHVSLLRRYAYPAPPMRTSEDARWLAAHIRRALVMFGGLRS